MLILNMLKRKGSDVITITPDSTVAKAVSILAENKIGALVVSADGKSIDGILSERDIVRSIATDAARTLDDKVSELMTADVQTCTTDTSISELMEMMTQNRIRHVPVEVDGVLSGLVSIGDVVQARLHEVEDERKHIEQYITT